MSELSTRMNLIKTLLAAALPARVVTRDMMDFGERDRTELVKGIYTLISFGEGGYQNLNGREAMDGAQHIKLVGQFVLDESAAPSAVEDAEFAMVSELKSFIRARPIELCTLAMKSFAQSGQTGPPPYGWVAVELEFLA